MKNEYTLNILGRAISIRSEEPESRVRAVEALVSERLAGFGASSGVPINNALLLCCLSLAQDVLDERANHNALKERIRTRSSALLQKLDSLQLAAHG